MGSLLAPSGRECRDYNRKKVEVSARCIEKGTAWQEEGRETAGHLEEDSRDGDEGSGKDLERAELACPRPASISKSRKVLTTTWAIVECLLSGVIYGWPSLVIIFKEDGIFENLCDADGRNSTIHYATFHGNLTDNKISLGTGNETTSNSAVRSCTAQDEIFSLIFMICGILMTIGCAVFGYLQYMFGSRVTRLTSLSLYMLGTLCMAFLHRDRPWLLFIAAPAIAIAGPPILIVNIQVANMFSRGASFVVGVFTGTYDASAIVQLFVKFLYYSGISLRTSYIGISSLLVLLLANTFFVFPKTYIPKNEIELYIPDDKLDEINENDAQDKKALQARQSRRELSYINYTLPSLCDCIKSKLYLFHVLWLSLLQLRFYFYIGSLNAFLEFMTNGDKLQVNHYTNLSLYIQTAGLLGAPLIGSFLDIQRYRHRGGSTHTDRLISPTIMPLVVTCVISAAMSGVILIPSSFVLIPMFIVFTTFRAFLYGLVAAFIQMIFPARYFGTLWGITMVVGGLFSAFQYPLFIWMDVPPVGPMKVNILLLILTLLSFIHPVYIWLVCRRQNRLTKIRNKENVELIISENQERFTLKL